MPEGYLLQNLSLDTQAEVLKCHDVVRRQRQELLNAVLLGVRGTVQKQGEVLHLVAGELHDLSALLGELRPGSRDFH